MKVYIMMEDNGEQYEDYRSSVSAVFLDIDKASKACTEFNNPVFPPLLTNDEFHADLALVDLYQGDYSYYVYDIEYHKGRRKMQKAWITEFDIIE